MRNLPSIYVCSKYWKNPSSLEKVESFPFNPLQATFMNVGEIKSQGNNRVDETFEGAPFPVQLLKS